MANLPREPKVSENCRPAFRRQCRRNERIEPARPELADGVGRANRGSLTSAKDLQYNRAKISAPPQNLMLRETLGQLAGGQDLSLEQTRAAFDSIMRGECSPQEIGLLLTALAAKGETVDEIAGAAAAMRQHMTPIVSRHATLIDTCGTGGVGSKTFNISTAAALVTAAAGVPVAKHGNRSVTSRSGSADVLAALGVNIEADLPTITACLNELGICFCFAPLLHPAMKQVAAVRKQLGIRTVFNLLGPLTNPAHAPCQLLGVGLPELRHRMAAVLQRLGTRRALVICGDNRLGEVATFGPTYVTEVSNAGRRDSIWTPADFDVEPAELAMLEVAGPAESADVISGVFAGENNAARDIVLINAAAALFTADKATTLRQCMALARQAIDSGAVSELLQRLKQRSNQPTDASL